VVIQCVDKFPDPNNNLLNIIILYCKHFIGIEIETCMMYDGVIIIVLLSECTN